MKKKGFTLIELLIVIAIIGLLAAITIVYLGNPQTKARDARRLSDISNMRNALSLYFNDNNAYPATGSTSFGTYLKKLPADPGSGCYTGYAGYTYAAQSVSGVANQSYTISYCLENLPSGINGARQTTGATTLNYATPAGIADN